MLSGLSPLAVAARSGVVVPDWVTRGSTGAPAKTDADFANGRFWVEDAAYYNEAAWLEVIGGSKSGITRTIGPFIDPTGTNLLTNPDFTSNTTGWSVTGAGASIASVSSECELTSGDAVASLFQGIAGLGADCFQVSFTSRRGTSSSAHQSLTSVNSGLGSALYGGPAQTSTSMVTSTYLAPANATTMYFGLRKTSGSGGSGGTHYIDNASVKRVWPFQGFTQGAIGLAFDYTAPAAAVADEVLLQLDPDDEDDRLRVVRLVADDTVHVIFTKAGVEVANLNLGAVADGADFSVAISGALNAFSASLNGGVPVTDSAGGCPNVGVLRVNRSFTGNTATGTMKRLTVF